MNTEQKTEQKTEQNSEKRSAKKSGNKAGKLLILLGVLVLLVAGTAVAKNLTVKKQEEEAEEPEKPEIYSLTPTDVTTLSYTNDGETLSFTKSGEDGTWSLDGTPEFPLNQSRISSMLSALQSVEAEKTLQEKDVSDLSEYGLAEPACTVTVDGKQLSMGNESELDGYLYVSTGDGNVYLTDTSLLSAFDYDQDDLIQNETIPSMTNLTSFTVKTPDGTYEIDRIENSGIAYSDDYEYFMKDGDNYITLGTDKAEAFIEKVTQLGWTYCVDWNADDELLESSGLADPPVIVTVAYTDTYTKETDLTDSDGTPVTETVELPQEFVLYVSGGYARIKDSRMVYYIGEDLSETLTYTSVTELMPEEVLDLDFSDVTSVDVSHDGEMYTFEKVSETETDEEGNTQIVTSWKLSGQTVEFTEVSDTLRNMLSYGYAGMYPTDGEEKLAFLLHRTSKTHPETALSFLRYDSTNCVTVIDGQPTVLVHRTDVEDLVSTLGSMITEATAAAEEAAAAAAEAESEAATTETEAAATETEAVEPEEATEKPEN